MFAISDCKEVAFEPNQGPTVWTGLYDQFVGYDSLHRNLPRHGRNYNVACCDGHVEGIDLTRVFDPTNYAIRWNIDHQPHPETWP
jgi:prepilin-type processing-associated H-X9-DG protein